MDEPFPSNAIRRQPNSAVAPKPEEPKQKVLQPVVTGTVTRQKKGPGRKFTEFFFGSGPKLSARDVAQQVVVPAVKNTVADAIQEFVSQRLWGDSAPRRNGGLLRNAAQNGYVNYNRASGPSTLRQGPPQQPGLSQHARATHSFDEFKFEARIDAVEVLNTLNDVLAEYQQVSVRDLLNAVGETPTFVDENFGWYDLSTAGVRGARGGGYILVLPPTQSLDK